MHGSGWAGRSVAITGCGTGSITVLLPAQGTHSCACAEPGVPVADDSQPQPGGCWEISTPSRTEAAKAMPESGSESRVAR